MLPFCLMSCSPSVKPSGRPSSSEMRRERQMAISSAQLGSSARLVISKVLGDTWYIGQI